MKLTSTLSAMALASGLALTGGAVLADDHEIVIGMATAQSGWMQAYDKPAREAALIRI